MDGTPSDAVEVLLSDRALMRLAAQLADDSDTADEIAQQVRVQLWRRGIPAGGVERGWLARALRNRSRNLHRDAQRRTRHEQAAAQPEHCGDGAAQLALFEERRAAVVAAVRGLPEAERDVVVARFWEGLSPGAIAAARGERASTVRSRLSRALARLRQRLDAEHGGERAAWLLPLCGVRPDATATLHAGAGVGSVLFGGWMMKKSLIVAAFGVLTCLAWLVIARFVPGSDGGGPLTVERATASVAHTPNPIDAETMAPGAHRERTAGLGAGPVGGPAFRLLAEQDGGPLAGVPYWRGEAPREGLAALPPADAPRTDQAGVYDPADAPGDGSFLWFALDDSHSFGVPYDAVGPIRAPRLETVEIRMRGLAQGDPWRLVSWPLEIDPDHPDPTDVGDYWWREVLTQPGSHADSVVQRRLQEWVAVGPLTRLSGVAGLPYTVDAQPRDYGGPEPVVAVPPDRIHFTVGERRSTYRLEIYEADGVTQSTVGGRWFLKSPDDSWCGYRPVDGATTTIGWYRVDLHPRPELWVVLNDGEMFRVALPEASVAEVPVIRIVRGRGNPARQLACAPALPTSRDSFTVFVEAEQANGARRLTVADPLDPEGAGGGFWPSDDAIGWHLHQGKLAVFAAQRTLHRVWVVAKDGRLWEPAGDALRAWPTIAVESPDLAALTARYVDERGHGAVEVHFEIRVPQLAELSGQRLREDGWLRVDWLEARWFSGYGVRRSDGERTLPHWPLSDPWHKSSPRGTEHRFRLWPHDGSGFVDVTPR